MIYTSYFAKLNSLPDDIIPISICGKVPDWYVGLQYKKLAPKYDFFIKWKKDHDNESYIKYYIKCFNEQVLDKLNAAEVLLDLSSIMLDLGKTDVCLVCYERPEDFCHRHLVADWLNKNGIQCEEYKF